MKPLFNGKDLSDFEFPYAEKKSCWYVDQGNLVCNNLEDQRDATLQFNKAKLPDSFSVSIAFRAEDASRGNFALEFATASSTPRWVVVLTSNGSMNVQRHDASSNKWTALVPWKKVIKQADQSNWNALELTFEKGTLSAFLNGNETLKTEMEESLAGGYLGMRSRGGRYYFKDVIFKPAGK